MTSGHLWLAVIIACGLLGFWGSGVVHAQSTGDNPHGQLKQSCEDCHTTEGWKPIRATPAFNHNETAFSLVGRHEHVSCEACHTSLEFSKVGTRCLDCHLDIHRGQFADACETCHTPEKWVDDAEWSRRHQTTRFPLTGVHSNLDCQSCHPGSQYAGISLNCESCHLKQYLATTNPNHISASFPTNCSQCHTVLSGNWLSNFNHNSIFPLTGMHASIQCTQCHANGQFVGAPTNCFGCHAANYNGANNPPHASNNFDHNCATCHSTSAWQPATFNHNNTTFPLSGQHLTIACSACHVSGNFTTIPTDCYACHQANFNGATNPNHVTGSYPHDCLACHHTTTDWNGATFDHNSVGFPLTGRHATTACNSCHANGQFAGTPTDCWSCHQAQYNATTDPNHAAQGFSHDCSQCHNTSGWGDANFDHATTTFPLTGVHVTTQCLQCHVNNQFTGIPTDCWSCHQTVYGTASSPPHASNQFNHDCTGCHNTAAWQPSTFSHANTVFPLAGTHATTTCVQCHVSGNYATVPTDCWSCHQSVYNSATSPPHASNQFGHDCSVCHSSTAWQPSTFNHANTVFPLTGQHTSLSCVQCHVSGNYTTVPSDCWSCHQAQYNATNDPNHAAGNYPHDCSICHNTNGWGDAAFNHATSAFPLTGAHTTVTCAQCHVNGHFAGTPTDCWSCHQTVYNSAANPSHTTNLFDHNCTICHSTAAWQPSTFNHSSSTFPLTGAHTTLTCVQCHVGGQYASTPSNCYYCHQGVYNSGTDPNHTAAGFGQNCQTCHTTSNWNAQWQPHEPFFPIYSGRHSSVWTTCATCHTSSSNYTQFSCINCHTHSNQANVDGEHDGVSGYSYGPMTCYTCHPTGGGGGFMKRARARIQPGEK